MQIKYLFVFLLLIGQASAYAANVDVFYGEGCPHCANAIEFLQELNQSFNVNYYELYFHPQNSSYFTKVMSSKNMTPSGVPTIIIGDEVFVGFNSQISKQIENQIIYCNENNCNNEVVETKNIEKITIPAVISAALVDAINPCAFAVLIILLSTILVTKNKRKALFAGLAFSFSIFISYFLMGLGLYSALTTVKLTNILYVVIGIVAIVLGLFNLKDYFWYGKGFLMEVPMSWRPKLKQLLKSVTSIPGAFIIGFVISLFLLPCTSGPYIVILGLLSQIATRNQAIGYLLLYNLIFILPMVLITLAVRFGLTNVEKAETVRKSKLRLLHLIAALVLITIGVLVLIFAIK